LENSVCVEVDTPKGKATLVKVYVTELGHLMAKVYHKKEKVWTNYKIGEISNLMETANIKVLSSTTTKRTVLKKKFDFKAQTETELEKVD
jgi:50S ribosomal subunit-associated GTPase HflX